MTTTQATPRHAELFNEYGHFIGKLSPECVRECSAHMGFEAVTKWRRQLDFQVPRELAIEWLASTGGWPKQSDKWSAGLNEMDDATLAGKVLWLACCDIRALGEWSGICH